MSLKHSTHNKHAPFWAEITLYIFSLCLFQVLYLKVFLIVSYYTHKKRFHKTFYLYVYAVSIITVYTTILMNVSFKETV